MSEEKNHIEDFFKKHLSVEQDSFLEDDWAKMEEKLDTAGLGISNSDGLSRIKLFALILLSSAVAFLIGWFLRPYFDQQPTIALINQNSNRNSNELIATEKSLENYLPSDSHNSTFSIKNEKTKESNEGDGGNSSSIAQSYRSNYFIPEKNEPQILYTHYPIYLRRIGLGGSSNIPLIDISPEPIQNSSLQTFNQEKESTKKFVRWTDWSVGVSIAPDFNSVGLFQSKQVTGKTGIRLFWNVLPRTTLQVGAFYNHKKYVANGEDYHPPAGYWGWATNGIVPSQIDGSCRVIDIPVFISHQFVDRGKWRFGAFTGLSNYIMLDQKYDYYFDQPNAGAADSWNTNQNVTLKWSILNLGLSAEYKLGTKTSISVEPYVQTPLKEIGWANVSLYGSGALFTIKRSLK